MPDKRGSGAFNIGEIKGAVIYPFWGITDGLLLHVVLKTVE